jgi:aldehyde dehydrogenase (NAD+)
MGPLVSDEHRRRVVGYIEKGESEGARKLTGGPRAAPGFYVDPTVFSGVDESMSIAREEIFGPVLAVIPFDDIDDAVRIANDSDYGLSGSVWSRDVAAGVDVAKRVRTGTYTVNGFMIEFSCPFGGFKQSGIGRELGPEGLAAYLEAKSISLPAGYEP